MAPASANPGRPSFSLLCAQSKHSAGRRSPERGREAVGLQATTAGVLLSQVLAHLPKAGYAIDTAQFSRAAPSKGVTSCCAENTGVPRRGGCPERPLHSGLRNALPAYFLGSAGCARGLDTPAPPPPRGASDLEDPTTRKWGGEATPGHPSASPGIPLGPQGEARQPEGEDPRPSSSPTLPQASQLTRCLPAASPRELYFSFLSENN